MDPDDPVDVEGPVRMSSEPVPPVDVPEERIRAPETPDAPAATPVVTVMPPVAPDSVVPVENRIAPDAPVLMALAVARAITPEAPAAVGAPDTKYTDPPVDADEGPAEITTDPPVLPLPDRRDKDPARAWEAVPDWIRIPPDLPVETDAPDDRIKFPVDEPEDEPEVTVTAAVIVEEDPVPTVSEPDFDPVATPAYTYDGQLETVAMSVHSVFIFFAYQPKNKKMGHRS